MSEAEALAKWDAYLWKQAHAFYRLSEQHTLTLDDLIQEARLAFLQHIRTHDESMWAACTLTIKGAMMECVRRNYPLKVSRNNFKRLLHEGIVFLALETGIDTDGICYEDDHSGIDLRTAIAKLTTAEREIICLRLEGLNVMEIADKTNTSHQKISYRLKVIREKMLS